MNVSSLLKSPYVLGASGFAGSGGLGVGAWQAYEGANPTNHRNLTKQGYRYSPVVAPNEEKPENKKWNLTSWDCVNRLFPGIDIKYEANSTAANEEYEVNLPPTNNPDKFITCAIMEMRPVSVAGASTKNQIYSKTEVVIKGENYGWILWTWISGISQKQNENSYEHPLNFIYRVMQVKKNGGKWEVESGVEWNHWVASGCKYQEQLVIAPPTNREGWFTEKNPRRCTESTPFRERLWVGLGEVVENSRNGDKDLLGSFSIYNIDDNVENRELWESGGEFTPKGDQTKGYGYVDEVYLKGQGWKRSKTGKSISDKLKAWYVPFKDKKIRWSNLEDRCNGWSKIRNRPITREGEDLRNLCYQRAN